MKITPAVPESQAIRQRRELVEGGETLRGITFQAIEHAVRSALDASAVAEAKREAGLADARFEPMSKYPLADFLRFEETAAHRMAPEVGGFDAAICRIGGAAVERFFDSIAGKTMALLAGKDPTRLLSAAPNGYGLLTSYGTRTWKQTGANTGVFRFEREFLGPVHNYGTFDTALRLVHGVDATFELEHESVLDFAFRIRW